MNQTMVYLRGYRCIFAEGSKEMLLVPSEKCFPFLTYGEAAAVISEGYMARSNGGLCPQCFAKPSRRDLDTWRCEECRTQW